MWLPTLAWIVVLQKPKFFLERLLRWLPLLSTLGIDILLYQKKPILLTLAGCFGALLLRHMLLYKCVLKKYIVISTILPSSLFLSIFWF